MAATLHAFARNLRAGLRLAFFLPVERLAFRIDLTQLLLLFALSALIDIGGDWFRVAAPRELSLLGAGSELYAAGLLLLAAALIAIFNRQSPLALALPVIVLAALPVVQALHYLPSVAAPWLRRGSSGLVFEYVIICWIIVVLIRSAAVAFSPQPPFVWLRAIGGGLLLASPIWFANELFPNEPWWRVQEDGPVREAGINAGSEAVLAEQAFLLNNALDRLADERPGLTDLYFVGFAPYGRGDVFRKDVEAAQKVMDTRWRTDSRSIVLLNNPRTLLTVPFATVTNLRETLNEVGAIIDAEDDVVMLYLVSHGSADHRLSADQWPLSLVELTPGGLKQLLDDAGIKWRIIVVSACYSGGFIQPLQDEHTLIVTASQADRTSFGCEDGSESTFFGEAFFQQGLAKAESIDAAFELAKIRVGERERSEGYTPPSNPQIFVGDAMADKMKTLRKRGFGGATARRTVPVPAPAG
jgi:Peptidase C13 family